MNKISQMSIFIMRLSLGALFLYSGVTKLLGGFSAEGYLLNAVSGPFEDFFASLAGFALVDLLVVYGQIGIGLSLVLGVFLRLGSVVGIIMMLLFYISSLPSEHGLIDEHIIYSIAFLILGASGAGRYLGIDKYLERVKLVKEKFKVFRYILG